MARFYSLSIEPTMFGAFVLNRSWGRLGTWGQSRLEYFPDLSAARARKEQLTCELARGRDADRHHKPLKFRHLTGSHPNAVSQPPSNDAG
ncbi:WGR domain-containing protein [Roseibium salinum]